MAGVSEEEGKCDLGDTNCNLAGLLADLESSVTAIVKTCELQSKEAKATGNEFLVRCLQNCRQLQQKLSNHGDCGQDDKSYIHDLLKLYAQVVLDGTFYEENQLVDSDFQHPLAQKTIRQLLEQLSQPEQLIIQRLKEDSKEVLGVEVLECLYWRRGALLYMYCATQQHDDVFLQFAEEGVLYLKKMLQVRQTGHHGDQLGRENVTTSDEDTFTLIQKGAYSDTHVLALMYGGELCYWITTSNHTSSTAPQPCSHGNSIDPIATGVRWLQVYIELSEGPLSGQGWDTHRAKELVTKLQQYITSNS